MSEKYFSKFPLISYNNQVAVNITERVVVRDFPANNALLYYSYDIDNYERPDQLADRYLNDEYMSWMIYLSNGITDPYYDWIIPDSAFNDYLKKKYGNDGLDKITAKVAYYQNNWYSDQNIITVGQYNDLPDLVKYDSLGKQYLGSAKRYYETVLINGDVSAYKRKRIDETLVTNKIVQYTITGTSNFSNNEIVNVKFGYVGESYFTTGKGQILTSNSTTATIQHTSGYVDIAPAGYTLSFSNSYVYGTESASNCAISAIHNHANNIIEAESLYWSPVTIYEMEYEKNLKNKTIRLIDSTVAPDVAQRTADTLASLL